MDCATCSIHINTQLTAMLCCPTCCHHQPGKVCDEDHMTMDIKLMKAANINAVRCSHYPNDNRWYV
jgi:hypothetical protein